MRPPGSETVLVLADATWNDWGAPPTGNAPRRDTGMTLVTADIDAAYATLLGRGVRFRGPVTILEWGQRGTWFDDLDGYEFFLVEG